jgi:hypothetical protein
VAHPDLAAASNVNRKPKENNSQKKKPSARKHALPNTKLQVVAQEEEAGQ